MRRYKLYFCLLLSLVACCQDKKKLATQREIEILQNKTLARDDSMDTLLVQVLEGINCLSQKHLGKRLVLANEHDVKDPNQILLIPYAALGNEYLTVAYSNIENGYIIFQPSQAKSFTTKNALNPSNSLKDVINLVLLHELGHFKIQKDGAFDNPGEKASQVGQMRMDTEPEYLTSAKKIELSADSVAANMVKAAVKGIVRSQEACYFTANSVQLVCSSMAFQVFGIRLLDQFGMVSILRDPNSTHPNLELRLAFINYFLYPTLEQRKAIDDYLYDREVAPVHRQEFEPRIFQEKEKDLPKFNY